MILGKRISVRNIKKHILKLVTMEQNDLLLNEITMKEVQNGIMEIPKCMSQGPNDITIDFY